MVVLNPESGKEKTVYAGTAILQKPTWMPDSEHLVLIFHDVSSDWNGQVGEIAIAAGKLHRITNDLNSYSNLTLGVTKDGKELVAIQITPQAAIYTMSSDANGSATAKQIDNHGEVGVGWLPDGRLVAMDYDGHIYVMNADGSNRSIIYPGTPSYVGVVGVSGWRKRAVLDAEQGNQGDQRLAAGSAERRGKRGQTKGMSTRMLRARPTAKRFCIRALSKESDC